MPTPVLSGKMSKRKRKESRERWKEQFYDMTVDVKRKVKGKK